MLTHRARADRVARGDGYGDRPRSSDRARRGPARNPSASPSRRARPSAPPGRCGVPRGGWRRSDRQGGTPWGARTAWLGPDQKTRAVERACDRFSGAGGRRDRAGGRVLIEGQGAERPARQRRAEPIHPCYMPRAWAGFALPRPRMLGGNSQPRSGWRVVQRPVSSTSWRPVRDSLSITSGAIRLTVISTARSGTVTRPRTAVAGPRAGRSAA